MRGRWTWVTWSMLAVFVAGYGVGIPLSVANDNFEQDSSLLLAFAAFMIVGAVIVAHRPGNAVGWIFSAIGLLTATGVAATEYAAYVARTRSGSLPGVVLAAWYTSWWWYPTLVGVLVFTPLVFPTGRLLSTRWRPVAVVAAVGTAAIITLSALQPTLQDEDHHPIRNPIGLAGVPDPEEGALGAILFGLLLLCAAAAVTSVVLRFRRSQGIERQQLKWFTYAATLLVLFMLVTDYLLPPSGVVEVLYGLVVALVPVAAGVAVLRYRLYDIDRLINRTLVYGLTAILGLCYLAGSLVFILVVGVGSGPPSWLVAAATLTVAAVFRPARRRIQAAVDRRFNRRRYNAAKTIEAFSTRLREQIDLDTLSTEVLAVVDQTMEPTRVSLWLRPSTHGPSSTARTGAGPLTGPTEYAKSHLS